MWQKLGKFVLRYRLALLVVLFGSTAFMLYHALKVQISYEFVRTIPVDNPLYKQYLAFKKQFGDDGNMLVIGCKTDSLFEKKVFNDYTGLYKALKAVDKVEGVLSVAGAVNLVKNDSTLKLDVQPVFPRQVLSQHNLDSAVDVFYSLPFYKGLLYNPETKAYLIGVRINKDVLGSKAREKVIAQIESLAYHFGEKHNIDIHISGLPLIRTNMAIKVEKEMRWFLVGSVLISAVILLLFFRSVSATVLSLGVVIAGVIWSMGIMHLFGYNISLLTALIPPLVVVIGIPNCIYFLNKYHTAWLHTGEKHRALVEMVSRMGIVTLFCNISAAIGFAVFALTKSAILKEFGMVAGISIMAIFFISLAAIPAVLSYLPAPKTRHIQYLETRWLDEVLTRVESWVFNHTKIIYIVTGLIIVFSISGMFRLVSVGHMVDDIPQTDRIYTDLKFFEKHFKGIMPLEIIVDTKKKYGFVGMKALDIFQKIDSLSRYIAAKPEMARPLSLVEGLKFAKQGFYDGDSANYALPNAFDGAFVNDYLKVNKGSDNAGNTFQQLMNAFMDSTRQKTRISVNMADVGSKKLPPILADIKRRSDELFDSTKYNVEFTGTSVTFLEGSRFIISGLQESIMWAFLLISLCMLYLFKSVRILICSLIPNIVPLMLTAGIMGWVGVPLKPSTVLIFGIALGIAIDVTIRFLVNYRQELPANHNMVKPTILQTIRHTGISIIYTSLVLIAGFSIFIFSGFGGTKALGWLTSLTLLSATVTNLVLLPVLLAILHRPKQAKSM
ncbi:efflux RND transporter permease subunit [Agriterribacter sp.]|uniref:efflux RND transporter permease subunit n=1 Tax=Agriterribacter sp. TaxID=2821509 RepID=UPI002D0DC498|nr:MMPL family transporter [Agriterribacter sp.]HTN07805.1 MMPL family transporter [Agriterribacter sp.]